MKNLIHALEQKFKKHRIVFWYDEKGEFEDNVRELTLKDVEILEVQDNEFEIKYRILKQSPEQAFLLYFKSPEPPYENNWLLDVQLAHAVFRTEMEALYLQELGLDYHLKEFVSEHMKFFEAKERRQKLKALIGQDDTQSVLRSKMLAVVFNTDFVTYQAFIQAHASAYLKGNESINKELDRYCLKDTYWSEIKNHYRYENDKPTIYDFLISVFQNNFSLGKSNKLARETKLLLAAWKNSVPYQEDFRQLSDKIAKDLDIEALLNTVEIDQVLDDDLFRLVDLKIIHDLAQLINGDNINYDKVLSIIKKRENKFWYPEYKEFYEALKYASELILYVKTHAEKRYASFDEGIEHYTKKLFVIDQDYRKFIWHYRRSGQKSILAGLAKRIEKIYSNDWLLQYNNNWQKIINDLDEWPNNKKISQQQFFAQHIKPYTDKKQKIFVIISDAFRYECGEEIYQRLQSESRYMADISYMASSLPSYTQLGMASLLPGKTFSLQENSDVVKIDGLSSSGTTGREKILKEQLRVRSTAINAEDLMSMNKNTTGRDFVVNHDLIYIYHNHIDKIGDDKASEVKVFEAVEEEIKLLISVIKKIASMNGVNMILTADHGFVYQHHELDESDYSGASFEGEVWKSNRRFVIGKNLNGDDLSKSFKGPQLNLDNDVDVLIPKSINRLRVKGAGARFIHGGAAMQEIVIPLINIKKKREDTTSKVEIDIIQSTNRITTNLLVVSFLQQDLVSETVLPRTIRAGLYAEDGTLLSDQFTYKFDKTEALERQREVKHDFQLSGKASGEYKNQSVKLKLEEPIEGTTRWRAYKDFTYTLNISFTSDF